MHSILLILLILSKHSSNLSHGTPLQAAVPRPKEGDATASASDAARNVGGNSSSLAPVPRTTPKLPEVVSPRPSEQQQVLDVLLNCKSVNLKDTGRVLAHGMGGSGKTTLSASIVRLEEVRGHFDRIAFVSAGQEPATLELQRVMHLQLVGQPMEEKSTGTSESQRGALQNAAAGKRWLVVLDDVWQVGHEQVLNFVDSGSSPECKVFVTTRFSRLFPGCEPMPPQFE